MSLYLTGRLVSYFPIPYSRVTGHPRKGWKIANRLGAVLTTHLYSPIIFREGIRKESHFIRSFWCILDFDGELSLDEACRMFCDTIHVIATTKHHQKPKGDAGPMDRFRVAIPWQEPISDLLTYRYNIKRAATEFGADEICHDAARLFYPSAKLVQFNLEGYTQGVAGVPLDSPLRKDYGATACKRPAQGLPAGVEAVIKCGVAQGKRNQTLYRVAKDLFSMGYHFDEVLAAVDGSPLLGGCDSPEQVLTTLRSAENSFRN